MRVRHAAATAQAPAAPGGGLIAFQSDEDLRNFLNEPARRAGGREGAVQALEAAPAAPTPLAAPAPAQAVTVTGARAQGITNNQEAGVD